MNKCILLLIEADSHDTALRIFSTLNDRGKPLSDADIFKTQFYKHYSSKGDEEKNNFIKKWKKLEETCNKLFPSTPNSSLDEIFTRYMYYERAKKRNKSSTTIALRKFYEENKYALLRNDETFDNLIDLADFWTDVDDQDEDKFSNDVLKRLFVLNYAPNGMWTYFVSVYYMKNRDKDGHFKGKEFCQFLDKIIAFIWAYAVTNPGVNALRTHIYAEMINVVNDEPVTFNDFLFDVDQVKNAFSNYEFTNSRRLTRSMLTWWAFHNPKQKLLKLKSNYDIEHIYAKDLQEKEDSFIDPDLIESLGNKSLLERKINRSASNHLFEFKRKLYRGEFNNKRTEIKDLLDIAEKPVFKEFDIGQRDDEIIHRFIEFMNNNDLLKKK